jgi:hypothetical protein
MSSFIGPLNHFTERSDPLDLVAVHKHLIDNGQAHVIA